MGLDGVIVCFVSETHITPQKMGDFRQPSIYLRLLLRFSIYLKRALFKPSSV